MPTPSCNGFESAIARAFRSATEEQICLVATVRLVTPQFLKVRALPLPYSCAGWWSFPTLVFCDPVTQTGHAEGLGVGGDVYFGTSNCKMGVAFEKRWPRDGSFRAAGSAKLLETLELLKKQSPQLLCVEMPQHLEALSTAVRGGCILWHSAARTEMMSRGAFHCTQHWPGQLEACSAIHLSLPVFTQNWGISAADEALRLFI